MQDKIVPSHRCHVTDVAYPKSPPDSYRTAGVGIKDIAPEQTDVAPGDDLGGQDAPENSRASEAGQAVDAAGRAAALEWGSSCAAISG